MERSRAHSWLAGRAALRWWRPVLMDSCECLLISLTVQAGSSTPLARPVIGIGHRMSGAICFSLLYISLQEYDQILTGTPWWRIRNFRSLTYLTVAVQVYHVSIKILWKKTNYYYILIIGWEVYFYKVCHLSLNSANLYTSSWTYIKPYSCC